MSEAVSETPAVEESLQAFVETLCESETYRQFVDASEQRSMSAPSGGSSGLRGAPV